MIPVLPNQYSINDDGQLQHFIRKKKTLIIADFYPVVLKRNVLTNVTKGETSDKVDVEFFVEGGISCGSFELQLNNLKKVDYQKLDSRLTIPPEPRNAKSHIAYVIQHQARNAPIDNVKVVDQLGWHKLGNGERIYCAGDKVISANGASDVKASETLAGFELEVSEKLSENEAMGKAFKIANIEPSVSYITYGYMLVGIMRQIFIDAGVTPVSTPFLVGISGTRKTTIVTLATNLYNRSTNLKKCSTRINSTTPAAEEILHNLKDCLFLYDDLYKTLDPEVRKSNEKRLSAITRSYADNSARLTNRGGKSINAQLAVTGEYIPNIKTDLARLMILYVPDGGINKGRLSECQEEPLVLSTFAFYFIKWLAKNYDKCVAKIKDEFVTFRVSRAGKVAKFERFYEASFVLKCAMAFFCFYAVEKKAISPQKMDSILKELSGHINTSFSYQEKIMGNIAIKENRKINLSKELLQMENDGVISLGKKGDDYFVRRGFVYITCNYFSDALFRKMKYHISSKALSKYFEERHISFRGDNRNVIKYRGKWYLVLDQERLREDADSLEQSIENLFF